MSTSVASCCLVAHSRFSLKNIKNFDDKWFSLIMNAQIRRTEPYPGVFMRVHSPNHRKAIEFPSASVRPAQNK